MVAAALSVVVLGSLGYGWSQLQNLNDSLIRDVLDSAASGVVADQNILLVGLDARTDAQGDPLPPSLLAQLHAGDSADGQDKTDTMILLRITDLGGRTTAVSIPRDSYVELADGSGEHKINTAYGAGKRAASAALREQGVDGPELELLASERGAQVMVKTVEQLTGLTIHHYAAVNLAGFYNISQAVGGLPVCLNEPVRDGYSGAAFPAGPQTIDGPQVLAFIRQRHGLPNGDLDRVRRQQAVLASMARTVLSASTLADTTKLDRLTTAVRQSVMLDREWDVVSMIQLLRRVSAGDVEFTTIPVGSLSLQTPYDGEAVEVDPQRVREFFRRGTDGSPATNPTANLADPAPGDASTPLDQPVTTDGLTCVN